MALLVIVMIIKKVMIWLQAVPFTDQKYSFQVPLFFLQIEL